MKIEEFPKQKEEILQAPNNLEMEIQRPPLQGEEIESEPEDGSLTEICEGVEVCLYSRETASRPWIGRVAKVLPKGEFIINWFQQMGKSRKFFSMKNPDGSPMTAKQDMESIMFWGMSSSPDDSNYLELSSYWIRRINHEYKILDENFS